MAKNSPIGETLEKLGEVAKELEANLHRPRKAMLRTIPNLLPHPSTQEGESLDIPGFSQLDSYSCGAVAGWMVLKALQPDASFKDFYLLCSPTPEDGLGDRALLKALRASGVGISTKPGGMTFEGIKKAIGNGFPIITIVDRPGTENAHWVVIYGYRQKPKLVYLAGNNFLGIHSKQIGGPNPVPFQEYSRLSKGFSAYVCWGKV